MPPTQQNATKEIITPDSVPLIVAVGGVFDSLHWGHVTLLRAAAQTASALNAPLHVLINDDDSLRTLNRTHQHELLQRIMLVSLVVPNAGMQPFREMTPRNALLDLTGATLLDPKDPTAGRAVPTRQVIFFKGDDTIATLHTMERHNTVSEFGLPNVCYQFVPVVQGRYGAKLGTRALTGDAHA